MATLVSPGNVGAGEIGRDFGQKVSGAEQEQSMLPADDRDSKCEDVSACICNVRNWVDSAIANYFFCSYEEHAAAGSVHVLGGHRARARG